MQDPQVAEMLAAVREFQEDHDMTEAEAAALADTARHNRPLIPAKSLPTRERTNVQVSNR